MMFLAQAAAPIADTSYYIPMNPGMVAILGTMATASVLLAQVILKLLQGRWSALSGSQCKVSQSDIESVRKIKDVTSAYNQDGSLKIFHPSDKTDRQHEDLVKLIDGISATQQKTAEIQRDILEETRSIKASNVRLEARRCPQGAGQ